jgi:hypothetical protein
VCMRIFICKVSSILLLPPNRELVLFFGLFIDLIKPILICRIAKMGCGGYSLFVFYWDI